MDKELLIYRSDIHQLHSGNCWIILHFRNYTFANIVRIPPKIELIQNDEMEGFLFKIKYYLKDHKLYYNIINMKVIDNNPYSLGKDVYGVKHDVRDIHPILMKIILEFDRVCRKNNIPYALSFGSALGVYNYEGFVPWDDDIDVAINYFDTDRLVEALKKDLGDEFSFDCYEVNKKYNVLIPNFKIRYKNSYIKEKNTLTLPNRCKNGDGIFIDVVSFMGIPEDEKEHIKLLKYAKRRMPLYIFLDAFLRIHPFGMKRKLKKFEYECAEKYKDSDLVSQSVIIPFQDWGDEKDKLAYPKDVIYPFREYDFNGHKLYSFNNVEEFCRLCYGEKSLRKLVDGKWVDPYPVKKRNPKHNTTFNLNSSNRRK